jgi:hypothetical protein
MTLVSAMALGADCIDDCDLLRAGRTGQVLGHEVAAPSTLGTFLRAFTFGHVRQLDRVLADALTRAWAAGAGPGDDRLVVDVDSFVGEVHGRSKQGAAFGYTASAATTRASPRGPTPARSCTSASGRVRRTPRAACRGSQMGSSRGSRARPRPGPSCCAPARGSGQTRPSSAWSAPAGSSRSAFACNRRSGQRSSRSTSMPGRPSPTTRRRASRRPPIRGSTGPRLVVRRVRTLDRQGELLPRHQPNRRARRRRGRTPPARRRRARDPRPQRPGAGALSVRQVLRERRLDGHRVQRAQPAALDVGARAAEPDHPGRAHAAPAPARATRPADPRGQALDPAPPAALALARRVLPRAHAHPGARARRLTRRPATPPPHHAGQPQAAISAASTPPTTFSTEALPRRSTRPVARSPHLNGHATPAGRFSASRPPHRWIEVRLLPSGPDLVHGPTSCGDVRPSTPRRRADPEA